MTSDHQQTAQLSLNPPNLGPLQVVLQVSGAHAHAMFVSEHQQVRDAVEQALPKLREQLAAGGMGLGSASVSDGAAQQQALAKTAATARVARAPPRRKLQPPWRPV